MEMNRKTYLCEDKGNFSKWMKSMAILFAILSIIVLGIIIAG